MRYVTDLTARAAYSELAEAATPDAPNVDGELLKLKLGGADLSAIADADQDAVSVAVSRLTRMLEMPARKLMVTSKVVTEPSRHHHRCLPCVA